MKKYFTITYEVVGGNKTDTIMIWSNNIVNAIMEFTNTEIETAGFKVRYSTYAIVKIEC